MSALLHIGICTTHITSVNRVQKRALDTWNWSCRQLCADIWSLRTKHRSSSRQQVFIAAISSVLKAIFIKNKLGAI